MEHFESKGRPLSPSVKMCMTWFTIGFVFGMVTAVLIAMPFLALKT